MKQNAKCFSTNLLLSLLSLFLAAAGISRYIETDSGNILIHDIEVESYDCYLYGARLFRPLQASSMNRRPSILIVPGDSGNRYSGDHIAMEFARRGFVVLTIENKPQGTSGPIRTETPENPVDSAYTFLTTRFFTDPDRTGLIALYSGAETVNTSEHYEDFTSRAIISPKADDLPQSNAPVSIMTAKYETAPEYRPESISPENLTVFSASHFGMIANKGVIASLLEQFHKDLAIPNDSPFWFSAFSQRALILLLLRAVLLLLLIIICAGMSAIITRCPGENKIIRFLVTVAGVFIPVGFFILTVEFMNNFLISVRIGSPFHYLSPIRKISSYFSIFPFLLFIVITACLNLPGIKGKFYPADMCAAAAVLLSLFVFLPILFGNYSGWEILGITHLRVLIPFAAVLSVTDCLLIRIASNNKYSRTASVLSTGVIFYIIYCNLLDSVLI